QNTASAEEGASAAEELSSQATHLQQLVSHFKVKGMVGAGLQRQALPPASDHQSKPQPQEGWDSMQGALEGSDPSEVISLDDEEFGKY
ncbi:MAG: methyl-accepting chemotaxis protein, partial [Desulfobulbaceae bacterium]|nr:methyl-accepting chemotaxis protein [Desulfobulbaceae bacterium]